MARIVERLTALGVARTKKRGMHADGGGLYLQVTGDGGKSWIYRFTLRGQTREMGLGSLTAISLSDARSKAGECRRQKQEGIDPIEARRVLRAQLKLDEAKAITFKDAARTFIAAHRAGWHNAKHAEQWTSTLETYAEPVFGSVSVHDVDTNLVLKALEPIWTTKPETAARVRGRIEAILNWAKVRGYRTGDNPARWRNHLDHLLPARSKVRAIKHHSALAYRDMPDFMQALGQQKGTAARALEFTILTAARTGETIGATLDELSTAEKIWTMPAERMKAGKEHRVPLCNRALTVIAEMQASRNPDQRFLFPGGKPGKPLSNMAMAELLKRMGQTEITVHGFRSTFRDWAAERTDYPHEVAEMALAHAVGDKVEAAYRRGDMFDKRRKLMEAWAAYCAMPKAGKIVALRR
jgi:integrase